MYNYVTSYIKGKIMKCFKILMMFYMIIGLVKVLNNPIDTNTHMIQKASPTFSGISHKL